MSHPAIDSALYFSGLPATYFINKTCALWGRGTAAPSRFPACTGRSDAKAPRRIESLCAVSCYNGIITKYREIVNKNPHFRGNCDLIINKDTFKNSINKFIIILLIKILNIENYIEYMPLQEDMDSFYNSIDCLLVPSIKEPFGLVVTEAMAHSLPTIVSSVTGAADIIKNEENGFIIDYSKLNKSKELFKTMCKVLNLNDEKYKNISKNAYNTVKNMTYDKFAEEFVNIAEKINKI